jgi:hypothetical protein
MSNTTMRNITMRNPIPMHVMSAALAGAIQHGRENPTHKICFAEVWLPDFSLDSASASANSSPLTPAIVSILCNRDLCRIYEAGASCRLLHKPSSKLKEGEGEGEYYFRVVLCNPSFNAIPLPVVRISPKFVVVVDGELRTTLGSKTEVLNYLSYAGFFDHLPPFKRLMADPSLYCGNIKWHIEDQQEFSK